MYKYKFTKFKFDMYLYPPRKLIRVQGGCCWKGAEWYGAGAGERGMHDPVFTTLAQRLIDRQTWLPHFTSNSKQSASFASL